MSPVLIAVLCVLAVLVLFVLYLVIRAAAFKPKASDLTEDTSTEEFDRDGAVAALQALVRCKTVSRDTHEEEDDAEFEKLIGLLPELYPNVIKNTELTRMDDRALLFRWKGKTEGDPAVMMAHYDVVPVDVPEDWDKPAFEGIIEDGVLWGRGTLDTKVTFNGILYGAEQLMKSGFTPEHDIYFAFSGGEEVNGRGAVHIRDYFKEQGIRPSLVIDEGGAVVRDIFPGVSGECALIGIAEKGMLNALYEVKSSGGHASAPKPHTPVGTLSAACAKVENHPFKAHLTKPVAEMFDTLGRHSTFVYRMIFSNFWLFGGLLDGICKKSGGELNALMRSTVAFTQMKGSDASNVIPQKASMVSNIRLNPEDTVDSALAYLKKTVGDETVEITAAANHMNPSSISSTDCDGYKRIVNAVRGTWKGAIVSPYLMVQCSDSRHWSEISDKVYRFSAMDLTADERHTIHGTNERIRLEVVGRATEFFIRVMKQC